MVLSWQVYAVKAHGTSHCDRGREQAAIPQRHSFQVAGNHQQHPVALETHNARLAAAFQFVGERKAGLYPRAAMGVGLRVVRVQGANTVIGGADICHGGSHGHEQEQVLRVHPNLLLYACVDALYREQQ